MFKRFFLFLLLVSTVLVSSPVQASNSTYDVAPATSPVKFTFSLSSEIPFVAGDVPFNSNFKGDGTYIVIIDTGIQRDHPFFQQRVALEACFAPKCPNGLTQQIGNGAATPVHWHGTHVAGIAAGFNSSYRGVAPNAKIIAINVFDTAGSAYDSDIVKALNWVNSISNQYNITSVNMSLGGSTPFKTTCDDYIPSLTQAIKNLKSNDIATVISSGNSYAHGMSAPACISHSVSVAAMYTNSTSITNFSNINIHTTIAAPGHSVLSSTTMSGYRLASGTSMAAPFVAGAFSVYRSAFGRHSVDKIISDFKSTPKRATDAYTSITIPYLHFSHLFTSTSPTTTVPFPPPTPTTTLPPPPPITTTTTTTTTTTLPPSSPPPTTLPSPSLGPVYTVRLHELDASWGSFIKAYYRDPHKGYSNISHYSIICNDSSEYTFTFPKTSRYGWNSYNIRVSPKLISHCKMNTHAYNGSVVSTRNMYITPRNKSLNLPLTFNSSFNFNQTPPDKNTFLSNKSNVKNKKKNSKNKKKKIKNNKQNKSSTLNKFK
jgi:subtilisin family serine protease